MKRPSKTPPPGSARLFTEPHAPPAPASTYTAFIDGASRGNPGPASYGMIVYAPDGKPVFQIGKYLGRETNNVAEYHALIAALDYAASQGHARLRVHSDSELLVRQMQGRYKVKSADLRPLYERASKLAHSLEYFGVQHVPREMNRDADRLANEALDKTGSRAFSPGQADAESGKVKMETPRVKPETIRVRANYVNGVLVPFEPLNLPEGTEVSFELRKTSKT